MTLLRCYHLSVRCAINIFLTPKLSNCLITILHLKTDQQFGKACKRIVECKYRRADCQRGSCSCIIAYSFDPGTGGCVKGWYI